jgi:hypothetical protein
MKIHFVAPHKKAIKMKTIFCSVSRSLSLLLLFCTLARNKISAFSHSRSFPFIKMLFFRFSSHSFQELAISSTEKRNWRGICIALLVISGVLSIIVFSIFLLSPGRWKLWGENCEWKCVSLSLISLLHSQLFLIDSVE